MRIRLSQLRRIIKEEVKRTLREGPDPEWLEDVKAALDGGQINYFEGMTAEEAADEWDDASGGITNGEAPRGEVVAALRNLGLK